MILVIGELAGRVDHGCRSKTIISPITEYEHQLQTIPLNHRMKGISLTSQIHKIFSSTLIYLRMMTVSCVYRYVCAGWLSG